MQHLSSVHKSQHVILYLVVFITVCWTCLARVAGGEKKFNTTDLTSHLKCCCCSCCIFLNSASLPWWHVKWLLLWWNFFSSSVFAEHILHVAAVSHPLPPSRTTRWQTADYMRIPLKCELIRIGQQRLWIIGYGWSNRLKFLTSCVPTLNY